MQRRRMTARRTLLASALAVLAVPAAAPAVPPDPGRASAPAAIFPVLGSVRYTNDFGQARGKSRHEGIDIVAPRKAVAVAVEAGTVKLWHGSGAAGCMLYLHGVSGTTYLYIHLNNDLGSGNDNRGKCVAGVAFAPGLRDGARVEAGQHVGYVGDSSDADEITPHLHFELHPGGGAAVDQYAFLRSARRLLLSAKPGATFTLAPTGKVASFDGATLTIKVERVRSWPGGRLVRQDSPAIAVSASQLALSDSVPTKKPVTVWTAPAPATLDAQLGLPGALQAERVTAR